jgi:hypothetical protein
MGCSTDHVAVVGEEGGCLADGEIEHIGHVEMYRSG